MKYKVGDKVRIKSLGWYDENKDVYGYIECGKSSMNFETSQLCGKIVTISRINDATNTYRIEEDNGFYNWTDEMIECKVEDECPQDFIEKYCKSCGTQRCDRTEEYLNGCPYYNAYMCKKQNNAMEEETKSEPKFKVGDILFYRGETCGYLKVEEIRKENGEIRYYETSRNLYLVENDPNVFADKVCSVETEETKPIDFTIKTTDTKGKVEVVIPDGYGYEIENDKLYFITKKREYPKTFLECCDVLNIGNLIERGVKGYKAELFDTLQKLYICRDAYWKIAGDEMGLDKPWEPDWHDEKQDKYGFHNEVKYTIINSATFVFPTAEMRDSFKKNFDPDIEICKKF